MNNYSLSDLIKGIDPVTDLIDEQHTKPRDCPLCGSRNSFEIFKKHGFRYDKCNDCDFVYVKRILVNNFHLTDECGKGRLGVGIDPKDAAWERSVRILKRIEQRFPGNKDISILDMGCGSGYFLRFAQQNGYENLTGVEIDLKASKYINEELGIKCHDRFLDEIGFPDNSFDVVVMDQVLEHVEEPKSLLTSLHKITRPNGFIYIGVPNVDSAIIKILGKNHRHFGGEAHLNYFTVQSLERMTRATGFDKIESYTIWEELTPAVLYCALRHPEVYGADPLIVSDTENTANKNKVDSCTPASSSEKNQIISSSKKIILRSLAPIDILCKFLTNYFNKGAYIEYFGSASEKKP